MEANNEKCLGEIAFSVLTIGAGWGIFEATAGYFLHLLPVSIGFLVWYPVAVLFLTAAHRITGKKSAILAVAALAASIKLLNLTLPGRIDRVINPAVSILFEGIAVFAAIYIFSRTKWAGRAEGKLLVGVGMNTLWRALYLGYLAFLVPDWMREVSVLRSGGSLLRFLIIDNLCSSLVVFAGWLFLAWLQKRGTQVPHIRIRLNGTARMLVPAVLLALNITLQMIF